MYGMTGLKAGLFGLAAGTAFALFAQRSRSHLFRNFHKRHILVAVLGAGSFGAYSGALYSGRRRLDTIGGLGSTFAKGSVTDRAQANVILNQYKDRVAAANGRLRDRQP